MTSRWLRPAVLAGLVIGTPLALAGVVATADGAPAPAPQLAVGAGAGKSAEPVARGVDTSGGITEQVTESLSAGTYTAITPFRAFDSRVNADRKFFHGDDENIDVLTDLHGNPMIPSTATAVSFNLTVTETESTFGFVTLFNGDAALIPQTSTINWVLPNFTIANGGIVAVGGPGAYLGDVGLTVSGAPNAAAHVIIDVTGYYSP